MKQKEPDKYKRYVVTDIPKFAEAPGHHSPPPSWIYPGMFPGINMRINAADVSKIVRDPHADPHIHEDNPEIYLAVTPNRGDIIIEVQNAICASLMLSPLNISVQTMLSTTKGIPMAK